jgi:hypothetical protein
MPDTSYSDIFALLLRIVAWFCLTIVVLALVSVLVPFIYFAVKNGKQGVKFKINTQSNNNRKENKQTVQIFIHPVLRPLLGFIKLRLQYDQTHFSEKFSLAERSQPKFINTTIEGLYHWPLPEIKEYKLENALIYFEDFFQFFSLTTSIQTNDRFYTQPIDRASKAISVFPRKTEDTSTRIEELKKVEGEYINYKNFENNDDVRRIVWKIYAKNKDLVVRIPEVLDPYASHIYLYASFFSAFDVTGNSAVEVPFLNFYKTVIWSVYRQLVQQGFEVRYVADQNLPQNNMPDAQQQVKYNISVSNWQRERDLKNYVKLSEASMLVISSLSDANQVKELIEKYGNDISFVFVPLTESLHKQHLGDWLQWLFVQQEKDDIAVYKTNWSLSLLRNKIVQNEKQLKKIVEQYHKSVVVSERQKV